MNLFLLALLPFAGAEDQQQCYTGTVKVDGGEITKDDLVDGMHLLLGAAFAKVVLSDKDLKAFMETRGTCQLDCLEKVVKPTMATLYGKMGKELMSDAGTNMGIEALTGAVRACYPAPPRAAIKEVATSILASLGQTPKEGSDMPMGIECPNKGHEDDFPVHEIKDAFEHVFEEVVKADPDATEFFQTKAMDCQFDCLDATVPQAMMTLFLTGRDPDASPEDKQVTLDAITGAMHACFPGVPSKTLGEMVKKTFAVLVDTSSKARLRLFASKWLIKDGSFNFFPLFSMVAAAAIMLFSAGLALGRVWKRSANSQIGECEDEKGLIEMEQLPE